jgi:hypothetical protein
MQVKMDLPRVNINSVTMAEGQPTTGYVGFNGTGLFRIEIGERK